MTDLRVYSDGEEIFVWRWEAHYVDGSVLKQYDKTFHKFAEIDQSKLASFWMVNMDPNIPPIILKWREGLKLIHFYAVKCMGFGSGNETIYRLYCFGYQEGDKKIIMTILPNGRVVVSNDCTEV